MRKDLTTSRRKVDMRSPCITRPSVVSAGQVGADSESTSRFSSLDIVLKQSKPRVVTYRELRPFINKQVVASILIVATTTKMESSWCQPYAASRRL